MHARIKPPPLSPTQPDDAASGAAAYDQAGDDYRSYADGDADDLFAFDSRYAYGDRQVWLVIEGLLAARRAAGARSIRILDAGCGPGTWLRRIVARAHELGFTEISARGFDIAGAQIRRARVLSHDLARLPGVRLTFEVGNMTRPFPESDGTVDLCLCLYGVLNHVSVACLPKVFAEFARVTGGHFVTTVRAAGSTPTIFVDSLEKAWRFEQDHLRNRCEVDLRDGRHVAFNSHLFTAGELRALAKERFDVETLRGLDLFHGRFSPDSRWNPPGLPCDRRLYDELDRLEEMYADDPSFMDRAAHLLLVARGARTC
jgi:SAM-dependent methyltransferase